MVNIERVAWIVLGGNTYANRERIKAVGGKFDNGSKTWMVQIETHPMNNTKQRTKLVKMLTELEENGVEFYRHLLDGRIK